MKASKVIARLQSLMDLNGDWEVAVMDHEYEAFDLVKRVKVKRTKPNRWQEATLPSCVFLIDRG